MFTDEDRLLLAYKRLSDYDKKHFLKLMEIFPCVSQNGRSTVFSVSAEYLAVDVLQYNFNKDLSEAHLPLVDVVPSTGANNGSHFDISVVGNVTSRSLLSEKYGGKIDRIQHKYKHPGGKTPTSRQVNIESSRRKTKANEGQTQTGHAAYGNNEFDMMMITLEHGQKDYYSLVPKHDLLGKDDRYLNTKVTPKLLEKYLIRKY